METADARQQVFEGQAPNVRVVQCDHAIETIPRALPTQRSGTPSCHELRTLVRCPWRRTGTADRQRHTSEAPQGAASL